MTSVPNTSYLIYTVWQDIWLGITTGGTVFNLLFRETDPRASVYLATLIPSVNFINLVVVQWLHHAGINEAFLKWLGYLIILHVITYVFCDGLIVWDAISNPTDAGGAGLILVIPLILIEGLDVWWLIEIYLGFKDYIRNPILSEQDSMTPEEKAAFKALDTNKDGEISTEEYAASLAL